MRTAGRRAAGAHHADLAAGGRARALAVARRAARDHLPEGWPGASAQDLDFDQTATTLTLASGKGANEIASDSPCPFRVPNFGDRDRFDPDRPFGVDRDDPAGRVVDGLAAMATDADNMEMLSRVLAEAGMPVRVVADERG